MSAVLKHIAAVAKGLNKAELHVLIELASRAESASGNDAIASSRELAQQTGLARASVQAAIDSLNRKDVIHSDAGSVTRSAMHRLSFLDTVENEGGGPTVRPGVAQIVSQGGLKTEPGVAQVLGQGGLNSGPPPNGKSITCEPAYIENASAPAKSIEKIDFDRLIDRLQKAQKSDFDDEVFEQARKLIAGHHAKFAREGWQIPGLPDDQITAQFLSIAEWPRLSNMLYDLMSERKQSSQSWAWYVTVALQRIHGVAPEQVRDIRVKLRRPGTPGAGTAPAMAKTRAGGIPPDSDQLRANYDRRRPGRELNNFHDQMRTLAVNKSLR